jgi:single-strand DNA-binding protein
MNNQVILIGNAGRDAELGYTANSLPLLKFSIAVTERYKEQEKTIWVRCTAFNKLAEAYAQRIKKGTQVLVEGKLDVNKWKDKTTGADKEMYSVIANTIRVIEKAPAGAYAQGGQTAQTSQAFGNFPPTMEEMDVPF